MTRHGTYPREFVPPASDYFASGRFGRMFGKLPPFSSDTPTVRAALIDIGKTGGLMDANDDLAAGPTQLIVDPALSANNPNNPALSAGMTFLGQFLDHDMTFDPTSSLERQVDPEYISNFRTPSFGLDNATGRGPPRARTYSISRARVKASASFWKRRVPPDAMICHATANRSH